MQKFAYILLGLLFFAPVAHAGGSMALLDDDGLAQIDGRWGMTVSYSALDASATHFQIWDFEGTGVVAIPGVEGFGARAQTYGGWLDFSSMRFAGRINGALNASIYSGNGSGVWTHAAGGMSVSNLGIDMARVNNTSGYSFLAISIPTMVGALQVEHVRLNASYYDVSGNYIERVGFGQVGLLIQDLTPYADTALYIFPQP